MPVGQCRTVCSLRPVAVVRIAFGHYSHLGLSQHIQRLLKVYCALIPFIWMSIRYFLCVEPSLVLSICRMTELLAHYSISMYTKDNYVQEYYKIIPAIDGAQWAGKVYSKLEKILRWFPVLLLVELICGMLCLKAYPVIGCSDLIVTFTSTCYILLGRMPLILIFSLLYCRAKIFRKNLMSTEGRTARGADENNHVLAYTALNQSLDDTGLPPMFLLTIQIIDWFMNMMYAGFKTSYFFKSENHEINYGYLLVSTLMIAIDTFLVFYPSIMVELASEEVEQSRIFIDNQLLTCTDEARCGELKELLYFLRHQPLQYQVLHAVPLTPRLPLALIMLGVNYLVCALQFTNTFGNNSTRVNATETP